VIERSLSRVHAPGPDLLNISIYDYRKFIIRSTYDSDLKLAEIYLRNIVSWFANTVSDDVTILHVNLTYEKLSIHCKLFCKLDVRRKLIVTLAL